MSPRISVAIPAFKPNFLGPAIASVQAQSLGDFELIIANTAVEEAPRAEIAALVEARRDDRVRYFADEGLSRDTAGSSVVRDWNRCLQRARGELFVMFSDDDVYESGFLEELAILADKYPDTDLFHCRVSIIDEMGRQLSLTPTCPEHEPFLDFVWHRLHDYRVQFAPDFLCRTAALRAVGGFQEMPLAWGTDDMTWFALARAGGVAYTPKVLCHWRRSSINITGAGDVETRLRALDRYDAWLREFLAGYEPADEFERGLVSLIAGTAVRWADNAKDSLFFTSVDRLGLLRRLLLFLKLKKRHRLRTKSLFKSLWRSLAEQGPAWTRGNPGG